jgi:hypothetical protein
MPKKITTPSKKVPAAKAKVTKVAAPEATVSTPVRYTAIPKAVAPVAQVQVTSEMIARKAFELFAAGRGGSELDHWFAAEAELRTAA